MPSDTMLLSVVIPLHNEAESIPPLLESLHAALSGVRHEVVLVDDGSTDATADVARQYVHDTVRLIELARNFGQTAALAAGIDTTRGDYIATMDGDLQNDPADIPLLLDTLVRQNLDLVTGWRKNRRDSMWRRRIPSVVANRLIRLACGIGLHDSGCTLKVMRAPIAQRIEWCGDMHRFIPALAQMAGGRIAEVEVQHHPRRFGKSKYGLSRTLHVLSDLMLLWFLRKCRDKPMHGFGTLGVVLLLADAAIMFYLIACLLIGHTTGGGVLLAIGVLLLIAALQLIAMGILAELMLRGDGAKRRKAYVVKAPRSDACA